MVAWSDLQTHGGGNTVAWSDLHKAFHGKGQPQSRETTKSRSIEGKYVSRHQTDYGDKKYIKP